MQNIRQLEPWPHGSLSLFESLSKLALWKWCFCLCPCQFLIISLPIHPVMGFMMFYGFCPNIGCPQIIQNPVVWINIVRDILRDKFEHMNWLHNLLTRIEIVMVIIQCPFVYPFALHCSTNTHQYHHYTYIYISSFTMFKHCYPHAPWSITIHHHLASFTIYQPYPTMSIIVLRIIQRIVSQLANHSYPLYTDHY